MTRDDAAALFTVMSDPLVAQSTDIELAERVEQVEELIDLYAARQARNTGLRWGITRQREDVVLGTAGFFPLDWRSRRGELGYELGSAHWGQGLMTEAVRALVRFGIEGLGLLRIDAATTLHNTASM